MKIYVLSPNVKTLFTDELREKLNTAGEVVFIEEQKELKDIDGLFAGDEDKILAVDPDFNNWKITNEDLDQIKNLKAVVLQTTSFSWVDGKHLAEKNIPLVNLRGFSTEAVSEWALMMTLNLARKIPVVIKDGWKEDYVKHQGIELKGKVAGIIGMGSIGTRTAELFQSIGMDIIYWSKNSTNDRFKRVELEELMKTADVISPHVAQNNETSSLLSDEMLKSMKPTAIFVSTIHNIYNHDLVLQMVKEGSLYGYGFEEDKGGKFIEYEGNVWGGPSLGWCTQESMKRNAEQWVEAIVKAANGDYETKVN